MSSGTQASISFGLHGGSPTQRTRTAPLHMVHELSIVHDSVAQPPQLKSHSSKHSHLQRATANFHMITWAQSLWALRSTWHAGRISPPVVSGNMTTVFSLSHVARQTRPIRTISSFYLSLLHDRPISHRTLSYRTMISRPSKSNQI